MTAANDAASPRKRSLHIPMLGDEDTTSTTPRPSPATDASEKTQSEINALKETVHAQPQDQPRAIQELSIGNLERARKKKVFLWRTATSAQGTLFAVLNLGYFPVHQVSHVQVLSPVTEWLILNFQEKIAWNLFRHASIQNRPALRLEIRKLLIQRYMPDTQKVADSYYRHSIPEYTLVDNADLQQAAYFGMIEKIDEYDPAVGCTFMQYANAKGMSRIQGAIKDCLRKHWYSTREVSKQRKRVKPLMLLLTHKLGHTPTVDDFCEHYGDDPWRQILEDPMFNMRVYNQTRTASNQDGDESMDQMTQVEDDQTPCENRWTSEDSKYFRRRILEILPDEKQAFCIYAYFWLGWNNEHIASDPIMNCSTSKTLEIMDAAHQRIFGIGGYELYHELKELLPDSK